MRCFSWILQPGCGVRAEAVRVALGKERLYFCLIFSLTCVFPVSPEGLCFSLLLLCLFISAVTLQECLLWKKSLRLSQTESKPAGESVPFFSCWGEGRPGESEKLSPGKDRKPGKVNAFFCLTNALTSTPKTSELLISRGGGVKLWGGF